MRNIFLFKLLFVILLLALMPYYHSFAADRYGSLPKLDGKKDSQLILQTQESSAVQQESEVGHPLKQDNFNDEHKEFAVETPVVKQGILDLSSPRETQLNNAVNAPVMSDSGVFNEYQDDLNGILAVLVQLKSLVGRGGTLQEFAAKATTARFLTETFRKKYQNTTASKYETYNLVQQIVKNAVFTKDFWYDSNQITSNQRGMNDKIIQTKFLEITTDVDRLLEILKIEGVLTQE